MALNRKSEKPKLKLTMSNKEKLTFAISVLCIIAIWYITITSYGNLPERTATHFNAL